MIWSEKLTNKLTIDPQAKKPTKIIKKQRRNNDKEENLMTTDEVRDTRSTKSVLNVMIHSHTSIHPKLKASYVMNILKQFI